jgi:hypothetical protein
MTQANAELASGPNKGPFRGLYESSKSLYAEIRPLWFVVIAGFLIRLVLSPVSLDGDLVGFAQTSASELFRQGPYAYSSIYPPLWAFYLNAVGHTVSVFQPVTYWFVSANGLGTLQAVSYGLTPSSGLSLSYVLIEKGSISLFDLGTSLVIYFLALRAYGRKDLAQTAFALWFLNPLVIIVSSIHGTFDDVAVFFMLSSILFALEGSFLFAGLSVAIGSWLKLFPLFLIPLLIGMILGRAIGGAGDRVRSLGSFLLGCLGVTLLAFGSPGTLSGFLTETLTGITGGETRYTGLGFWGLFSFPTFNFVTNLLSQNLSRTFDVLLPLSIVIAVLMGLVIFKESRTAVMKCQVWMMGAFLSVSAAYFVTTVTQPQYMLWTLPFLLLLGLQRKLYLACYGTITIASGVFYLLIIGGPYLFFLPLWYSFRLLTLHTILNSVTYWVGPGRIYAPLVQSVVGVATVIACVASLWGLVYKVRSVSFKFLKRGGSSEG